MDVVNPLSIILVKSDSKGDRLLFRYPYQHDQRQKQQLQQHQSSNNRNKHNNPQSSNTSSSAPRRRNPYAVREDTSASSAASSSSSSSPYTSSSHSHHGGGPLGGGGLGVCGSGSGYPQQQGADILQQPPPQTSNVLDGQLCGFTDEVLSTLFAVKPELCNRKFELKVNDVRFVAHPTLMQQSQHPPRQPQQQQKPPQEAAALAAAATVSPPIIVSRRVSISAVAVVDTSSSSSGSSSSPTTSPPQAACCSPNTPAPMTEITSTTYINTPPAPPDSPPFQQSQQSSSDSSASSSSTILINIVFALHAQASYSIVKCYYELSKRLGHALAFEEKRIGYLSDEMRLMVKTLDEAQHNDCPVEQTKMTKSSSAGLASQLGKGDGNAERNGRGGKDGRGSEEPSKGHHPAKASSPFDLILEQSTLAQCLKTIYHDLCTTGLLNTTINGWVTLSFCLPQKAHQLHKRGVCVEPDAIDRCLQSLKPYHGMLLLVDLNELLDCFPPSGARMLLQLLNAYNPLKTLQNMAAEADLAIQHVYELVGHLVYWAKATIIYPLCETNVYVIAPDAPLHSHSPLVDKFSAKFPGMSLFEVISDFSLPTSIGHLTTPLQHPTRQGTLAQMVLWMLQHHLLMQLHTYVQFMPTEHGECNSGAEEESSRSGSPTAGGGLVKSGAGGVLSVAADADEDINTLSQLSISSNPHAMLVPNSSRRSTTDDPTTGTISDTDNDGDEDDDQSALDEVVDETTVHPPQSPAQRAQFHNVGIVDTISKPAPELLKPAVLPIESADSSDSLAGSGGEDEDRIRELLLAFREPERSAVRELSAAGNADDLALMVKLWQAGYFKGEHHLEEIMYFENLRRSQLLQLLDKFRDVLIIYETEDPAIATLYTTHQHNLVDE